MKKITEPAIGKFLSKGNLGNVYNDETADCCALQSTALLTLYRITMELSP